MNKGIALAQGDIIGILNSDDIYTNAQVIEKIVEQFQITGSDTLYASLDFVDRHNLNKVKRRWKSGPYQREQFIAGWMPPHPTFFVRNEVYQKFGVFDLNMGTSADYELMLRLLYKNQCTSTFLDETIVKMRMGGASTTNLKAHLKANLNDRRAWKKNGLVPRWNTLYLKPLKKITQFLTKSNPT